MTNLSHTSGPTTTALLETTVGDALEQAAGLWGANLALVSRHQDFRWTWTQLNERVNRIAAGLLAQGVLKGDRVGIWAPNCAEWTVTQFATAKIGAKPLQVQVVPCPPIK